MSDPAAVTARWRQVLADVGYLRREVRRLGPKDEYVRHAHDFDEAAVRDVAAFERVYERLANELDHLVRDYLRKMASSREAAHTIEGSSMAAVLGGFATARKLPAASTDSLRRAANARNDLQHDYVNLRAAEVFDGAHQLLLGMPGVLDAVREAWADQGVTLPAPPLPRQSPG
ncbi:MAG: hypothetical protein ABR573_10490 [Candidatus Dormibacteria bacterium]